jgi:hypothetical protein
MEAQLLHVLRSKNRIPAEVLVRRLSELEQTGAHQESPPSPQNEKIEKTPPQKEITPILKEVEQPAQEAPKTPPEEMKEPVVVINEEKSFSPKAPPGKYETLLQFSAVELEGTIK